MSPEHPLQDNILAAIGHIEQKFEVISLDDFLRDLDRRRIVERCLEILSEASRRLPENLKERHPEIPWRKVAGIGNVTTTRKSFPTPCGSSQATVCLSSQPHAGRSWRGWAAVLPDEWVAKREADQAGICIMSPRLQITAGKPSCWI